MADEEKEAFNISLRLLARSAKSKSELERRLREKGVSEDALAPVITRLMALGFIDDDKFARSLAERYKTIKPSGRGRVVFELKKKGISPEVCRQVVNDYTPDEELAAACEVARKKWLSLASIEPGKRKKKTFDFLLRRGFDFETANQALRRAVSDDTE